LILTEEELKKRLKWSQQDHGLTTVIANEILQSHLSLLSANAELSFKNQKLVEKDAKVTEFMDWAKRIIDSGMGAGILRYDPIQFFIEYHTYLKSLEELK
jgi:hypothetical protein